MSRPGKFTILFVLMTLSLSLSACSMLDIREQTRQIEQLGMITGTVKSTVEQQGAIIVLCFRDEQGVPILESGMPVSAKGIYQFSRIPGTYYIGAFIDSNGDGTYQKSEFGNFHGSPDAITVTEKQTIELKPIIISGLIPQQDADQKAIDRRFEIQKNIGRITTLDDPSFTDENYSMGMWRPVDFVQQGFGGLFMLQPYQPDKIPVLFIHGVNGGPTHWKAIIDSLDQEKFQPWVIYYPSGFRLDMISDYIVNATVQLQSKYRFERFGVVAHSMGGLVTRSFIKKYVEKYPKTSENLKFAMTINSPMAGMSSATLGLKHSPIISSAWYDVAPDSEFLKDLHAWQWPETIPYHLVFSYKEGESGDGVVALQSQLPAKLQAESVRMYGFGDDHVGTLSDPLFLTLFNNLLADGFK